MNFLKLSHIEILKNMKLLAAVALLASSVGNASALQCRDLFSANRVVLNNADFANQLDALANMFLKLEARDISPENTPQAISHLNRTLAYLVLINPEAARLFKQRVAAIRSGVQSEINEKNRQQEAKLTERATIIQSVQFHEIAGGKFNMIQPNHALVNKSASMMEVRPQYVEKRISKPFAMMETLMTQMTFVKLQIAMGEKDPVKINPSYYREGTESKEVVIQGIRLNMKPDHPVENLDWYSVKDFIKKLNQLSKSDRPEIQTLMSQVFTGHQKGDVYDIPTEPQYEFVLTNRGKTYEKYFDQDHPEEINDYAWTAENSDLETNAVSSRKPRMIDGKPFYDLEGNVGEWTKDPFDASKHGKANAWGIVDDSRAVRGGNYGAKAKELQAGQRRCQDASSCSQQTGFRLVRTRL